MRHISRKIIAMSMGIMMAGSAVFHISVQTSIVAEAHSGRTDASGGHRDNKNKSGLGSYHYHCGGHPAHLHENGVCPYDTAVQETKAVRQETRAAVQETTAAVRETTVSGRHRNRQWSGQLPGQEKLPVLRAGIRMGHTGTISVRTEPV